MKRISILLLAALAGCSPAMVEPEMKVVTFEISLYESGRFPTKSFATEIASHLPASVEMTLENSVTHVTYPAVSGEAVTIPLGTYHITGTYMPDFVQKCYGSTKFTSFEPGIVVEDDIEVVANTDTYSVDASYTSFALGVVPTEVSSWKLKTKDQSMEEVICIEATDLHWVFVTGGFSSSTPFVTTITPTVGSSEGFNLVLDTPTDGQSRVEAGKWYVLHPAGAGTQSGTFDLGLADWSEGTIE